MPPAHTPNRIRYVLPFTHSQPGHRLGINSLALDTATTTDGSIARGILYSAGRDGMVSAWDLHLHLEKRAPEEANGRANGEILDDDGQKLALVSDGKGDSARGWNVESGQLPPTTFRAQVQAHTHWVNDILLSHGSTSVISCSSDMTVKLWRPHSVDHAIPTTLGSHADYVKCLASPGNWSNWVASGGLDRKIILWDVDGNGEIQRIEVGDGGEVQKGSVYALGTGGGILASGGPEKVVRIWDPRSGKRITKFVGHTDNIRSILLSDDGQTMLTASSDTTIKLWSLATRRCLNTFTMHSDSVWTLHSLHPRLEVFHAGDRGGLVTKTDIRGIGDIDEAECIAVYKEHHGVTKIVGVGDRLWSATSSSSINRWLDGPDWDPLPPPSTRHRSSTSQTRPSIPSPNTTSPPPQIPPQSFLRLTSVHDRLLQVGPVAHKDPDGSTAFSAIPSTSPTHVLGVDEQYHIIPIRDEPDSTIPGQHGLIKHILLNDRRRVLTLDTSHTVALWDIVECKQLESFGAKDIYEIEKSVNSNENVPNWCTVDTRIGSLTVMLDERSAFDAEMYRDEMGFDDEGDQRINIGKWVLRYLFANLIEAEILRDEEVRRTLELEALERKRTAEQEISKNPPLHISIPPPVHTTVGSGEATPRPRAWDAALSPGIGLATPAPVYDPSPGRASAMSPSDDVSTIASVNRDYFTGAVQNGEENQVPPTPSLPTETPSSPEPAKESTFMGRLKSFGAKKLATKAEKEDTPAVANGADKDENAEKTDEETTNGNSGATKDTPYTFADVLASIRKTYENALYPSEAVIDKSDEASVSSIAKIPVWDNGRLRSAITPSSSEDAPVIQPSQETIIIIAEQKVSVDGSMDLYRGTVASVGNDVDLLEGIAPGWLGELLLLDKIPKKEIVKISFSLKPHSSSKLPDMLAGLNANRMLRARKIVMYVAERIESEEIPSDIKEQPYLWLELLCQDKVVPPKWTLQTIRAQMWRQGGDILFTYRLRSERGDDQQ